ncbi:hypothetical protein AB0K51_07360 [Kitasatospora sp. NPDC049285]|uniref:hypothetical protein n=1 Tax=Kitasatospora sp. NPDC049285 TaxID=3157096 RepID=UPI003430A99C
MIDTPGLPDATWWGIVRERTTACWWQLLLVNLGLAVAHLVAMTATRFLGYNLTEILVQDGVGALLGALAWWVQLSVLTGARPDPRRIAPLTLWLLLCNPQTLQDVAWLWSPATLLDPTDLPVALLIAAVGIYLTAVGLLLPLPAFLEGRGPVRTVRLLHSGWPTALRLAALTFGTMAFRSAFLQFYSTAAGEPYVLLLNLVALPVSAVTAVLLYATYRRAVTPVDRYVGTGSLPDPVVSREMG